MRQRKAKQWILTYSGTKIVRAYRKRFHVDTTCALRDLNEIGYKFEPGYLENLKKAEAARLEQLRKKKEEKRLSAPYYNEFQDDNFFFIAGYTSGGAPYGVQWWEVGLDPYEDELDFDEDISENVQYDFLSESEKNFINNKLREPFS